MAQSNAFEGRVVFATRHASLMTLLEAERIEKAALAALGEVNDTIKAVVRDMAALVSQTESITFHFAGNEADMLTDLRDFWEAYARADDGPLLAARWRMSASFAVVSAWTRAVNAAESPYIDPETSPLEVLTPEQRKEAADPDSPLAVGGENDGATI